MTDKNLSLPATAVTVEPVFVEAGASVDPGSGVVSDRFRDVPKVAWYADAVTWAAQTAAVNGTSADTFSPNEPVTREQLAAEPVSDVTVYYRTSDLYTQEN